jgi:hypothetical protein
MTFEAFAASLIGDEEPSDLTVPLRALWRDGKGDWEGAHELAGLVETAAGALVHAYLHRKEGDVGNAHYWYRQAGRSPFDGTLEAEWAALAREFLKTIASPS